ncbi:MAG: SMC-Scp complex subunit ScpB [Cyanobacteria bacterium J06641_5]
MPPLAARVEAVLYLKAQTLKAKEIAEILGCTRVAVQNALLDLMDAYAHRDGALEVIETPSGYSLQLRSQFESLIGTLVPAEIGLGCLRTLAAIALKSPIVQTELIELRGSGVYQHVAELVEMGFVSKRRQSEGRSYWLEVTDKFHQYFEIDSVTQILARRDRFVVPPTAEPVEADDDGE